MLTYNTFSSLYPEFQGLDPLQVGQAVYDNFYADEYENRDEFLNTFANNNAALRASDLRRLEPAFADVPDDELFDATMATMGYDPNAQDSGVARAIFRGEADERSWGEFGSDTVRSFSSGANRMAGGVAWLAGRVLPGEAGDAADDLSETLGEYAERYTDNQSPALKQQQALVESRQQERVLEGDNILSRAGQAALDYTNPMMLTDVLAGSAAYAVPGGLLGKGGGLLARTAAARTTLPVVSEMAGTAIGASIGAGALEGADAATTTRDAILQMSPEDLNQFDMYRDLIADNVSPTIAREMVAQSQAKKAFAVTAPIATAAGLMFPGLETSLLTSTSIRDGFVKTLGKEGVEEFIQEGSNQLGVNVGTNRPLSEGVAEAAGAGIVAGIGQAGGLKAGGYAADTLSGRMPYIREADEYVKQAQAGSALSEEQIALVRAVYPELKENDGFFEKSRIARDGLSGVDFDGSFGQLNLFTGDVDPMTDPETGQGDLFDPADGIVDDATIEALPENPGQGDLFDGQGDLIDSMPTMRSPRTGGLDQPNEEALNTLEQASAGDTIDILPTRPEGLTNAEVYDVLARDQDAGGELTLAEAQFVTDYRAGDVVPDVQYEGQNGTVDRNAEPGLQRSQITTTIPIGQRDFALGQVEEDLDTNTLVDPQGNPLPSVPSTSREFKTKREATLAAKQREGEFEVFKTDAGKWRFRPAPPQPAPLASMPTEQTDIEDAPPLVQRPPAALDSQTREQEQAQRVLPGLEPTADTVEETPPLTETRGPAIEDELAPDIAQVRQERVRKGTALVDHFRPTITSWWSKLSPGKRLKVLKDNDLGDDISAMPEDERRAVLANKDINSLPDSVLSQEKLAERVAGDAAFRQSTGLPDDAELQRYGGYARQEIKPLKLEVEVAIEDSGETKVVKQNALKALDESDAQISKYESLFNCLGR